MLPSATELVDSLTPEAAGAMVQAGVTTVLAIYDTAGDDPARVAPQAVG